MGGWSCQWEWAEYLPGSPDDPTFGGARQAKEVELLSSYLSDQVRWLRNHPSLFLWVVGSDKLPWPDTEQRYKEILSILDPSRPYLASCKGLRSPVSGPTGVKMNGPYDYVTPNYWYADTKNGGAFGFNTETGPGPQIPPLASLRRMLPADKLWPMNEVWDFHGGRHEFKNMDGFLKAYAERYGKPDSLEAFAFQVQASNYEAMRAMFEAFGARQPRSTGVIQWMLNAAWPKLLWQLYDHYLMPNGAFYGARKACQPMAAVYDYATNSVHLVNDSPSDLVSATLRIRVFDFDSRERFSAELPASCTAGSARKAMDLPALPDSSPVSFLSLEIHAADGRRLADNLYWLSSKPDVLDEAKTTWFVTPNSTFADFKPLGHLPAARVSHRAAFHRGRTWELKVELANESDRIAFFNELRVVKNRSGEPVLPVFWEDNYISLLPGERRSVTARFDNSDLGGEVPRFELQGWNQAPAAPSKEIR